ncbi:beta-amyrin 11-oxidase-like [Momordica charantia]|uniref:Beta-amyrin 11-oxidase-like n=1 Tax=Momordica charantia TaxID=3673 RepID=A0A5K7U6A4_MOMCH|nr:beta-amyrin 11-oxidase-like [Momordica charantia]BBI21929.1 cytochrome P450 monooxygenase [Momordica charantia]
MELLSNFGAILGALLGLYILVFGFLRKFNDIWYRFKLGKNVYNALPPGDMGWPLVGSSLSFYQAFKIGGDPNAVMDNLISRFGRVRMYKSHLYGFPVIIVTDPEVCRRIYLDDEHFKLNYPKSVKLLQADGSLLKVDYKIVHRLMAAPINGVEALSRYVEFIEDAVVEGLEEWGSMKGPVPLLHEFKRLTFKIIIGVFLGPVFTDSEVAELESLYAEIGPAIMSIFPYNLPGFSYRRALKARIKVENIVRPVIQNRKKALENNVDLEETCQLDAVIKATDKNGERVFNDNAIICMLLGLLYAGYHTSAHGAQWTMVHVSENPDVYQKAKEEQEMIIKQRPPNQKGLNFKEIKQMKYTAKIINEVLRLNNIVFTNFRMATKDVNVNGYTIPKGWIAAMWIRGVHMDDKIYENPLEFNPSRWDNYTPKPGEYIPFGIGSRFCPGNELAKLEMTVLLHHFLLGYRWERVNRKALVSNIPIPALVDECLTNITKLPSY